MFSSLLSSRTESSSSLAYIKRLPAPAYACTNSIARGHCHGNHAPQHKLIQRDFMWSEEDEREATAEAAATKCQFMYWSVNKLSSTALHSSPRLSSPPLSARNSCFSLCYIAFKKLVSVHQRAYCVDLWSTDTIAPQRKSSAREKLIWAEPLMSTCRLTMIEPSLERINFQ
jgi:hypothetical protein